MRGKKKFSAATRPLYMAAPLLHGDLTTPLVLELSRLFRAYAEGSTLESIALKACTVLPVLLLQKPFRSSKQKDHSVGLARRLSVWKEISRNF